MNTDTKPSKMTPSQSARQRVVAEHTCPECGETFRGLRIAKFCSNRCRQANKNRKNRDKRLFGGD